MKTICLTGGLASGKSTASRFLEGKGAYLIDADKLGHQVYDTGTQGYRKVIDTFGEDIVDDENHIDRKKLGAIVFGNPKELARLTAIVWPEIRRLALLEITGFEAMDPDGVVVLEAAVLFEAGWDDIGDEVWVVIVDREVAIERAMARDGVTREAVELRLNTQLSNEERISRSTVVIDNNGEPEAMTEQLEQAWERFTSA